MISILIPCFNAEQWIGQCIESALSQTWLDKEIIVVDDGSTDGSLKIIQSFGNRIRFETGPNRGGNVTRNRLLELSKGDWLQYLDADDYLLPDKIEKQFRLISDNPDVDAIFSRVIQETRIGSEVRQEVSLMPESHEPWCLLVRWDLPQIGGLLLRRSAVISAGAWKIDQPCCQEHELYLRMLKSGHRFAYSAAIGAVYRQWHSGSVCTKNKPEVHRRRLEIIRNTEESLRERKELTNERLWAINQARLEVARQVWQYDSKFAVEINRTIRRSLPNFAPGGIEARIRYGTGYQMGYRLFGFQITEMIAGWRRSRQIAK